MYLPKKSLRALIINILRLQPGQILHISHGNADSINENVMKYLQVTNPNLKICEDANYPAPTYRNPLRNRKAIKRLQIEDEYFCNVSEYKIAEYILEKI